MDGEGCSNCSGGDAPFSALTAATTAKRRLDLLAILRLSAGAQLPP